MVQIDTLLTTVLDLSVRYLPKVLLALLTFFIGLKLINWSTKLIEYSLKRKRIDASLRHFLESFLSVSLKILLIISVASMIGIETTSFVAVLGAAGLAVGLALQGSLANFAGGVLILLFKPYKVGHFIEAQGHSGTVHKIDIFNTVLHTPDKKTIVLPNGAISNGSIINYSHQKQRRVDLTIGIGYDDDLKKAQRVLLEILAKHKKVLKDPASFARVGELADSSVNFSVRVWTEVEDYWDVHFDLIEQIKLRFDKEKNISFPFPTRDVNVYRRK